VADDAAGIALALEHLRGLGHRRIAYIAVAGEEVGDLRRAAYERAMRGAGLEDGLCVEPADNSEDGGFRAAVRLLTGGQPPTGIVAHNDLVAVGALTAARDLGVSVPKECSIVGYGNTELSRSRAIALTTVDQATFAVGQRAVEVLTWRMRAPAPEPKIVLLTPTLAVRLSTAPAGR
jgi:DNA-binding LacI/PurR family transcriptional regulator